MIGGLMEKAQHSKESYIQMLENYDWGYSKLNTTTAGTNGLRTPLILSDIIKNTIKDKVLCDLGACEGDFALCCKRYASRVIAVDIDEDKVEICRMKGLDAICGDLLTIEIPEADIYYIWIGRDSLKIYQRIKYNKLVIFGNQSGETKDAIEKLPNIVKNSFPYVRDSIPMIWDYYMKMK